MMNRKRKTAIWGYSSYGKNLRSIIEKDPSGAYEVSAIYDRALKGTAADGLTIRDPAEIDDGYQNGLFDCAAVCILDRNAAGQVRKKLKEKGIPVFPNPVRNRFTDAAQFNGAAEYTDENIPGGYRYFMFRDIFGANCGINDSLMMFDRDQNLCGAYLYRYQHEELDLAAFPVPYDRADIENALSLRGDYCMLAKIYNKNYWHFTFEAMDQVYLLEKAGFSGKYILQRTRFAKELLEILGIDPKDRVLWSDELPPGRVLRFERMHLLLKTDNSVETLYRFSESVRNRLREDGFSRSDHPRKIFVKRITNRKLLLPDQYFIDRGFQVVVPEDLSVREQIECFIGADLVFTPHGAGSTNSIYMDPGSVIIETFPNTYYNAANFGILVRKGVHYLPVVRTPILIDARNSGNRYIDYHMEDSLLENALSIAEKLIIK